MNSNEKITYRLPGKSITLKGNVGLMFLWLMHCRSVCNVWYVSWINKNSLHNCTYNCILRLHANVKFVFENLSVWFLFESSLVCVYFTSNTFAGDRDSVMEDKQSGLMVHVCVMLCSYVMSKLGHMCRYIAVHIQRAQMRYRASKLRIYMQHTIAWVLV